MRYLAKLRANTRLEGDLRLAEAEVAALTGASPEPILDWPAAGECLSSKEFLPSFHSHLKSGAIKGYTFSGAPNLLPSLIHRSTFLQEIYLLPEANETERLAALVRQHPDLVRVEGVNGLAVPLYTIVESSVPLARHAGGADEMDMLLSAFARFMLGVTDSHPAATRFGPALAGARPGSHLTHDLHIYKAKFFPRMIRSLLNTYAPGGSAPVLDPFSGSGTLLLEAALLGMPAHGLDIDPLSVLVSDLKTRALHMNPSEVQVDVDTVREVLRAGRRQPSPFESAPSVPALPPLSFPHWLRRKFDDEQYAALMADIDRVRRAVALAPDRSRDLFRVALSDAVTRKIKMRFLGTGVGRFAMTLSQASVSAMFERNVSAMPAMIAASQWIEGQLDYPLPANTARIGDARSMTVGQTGGPVDLIITSPPYLPASSGRETYSRARATSLLTLGMADPEEIDALDQEAVGSMRGSLSANGPLPAHARELVGWLQADDLRSIKAGPTERYFGDMDACFGAIYDVLGSGGRCLMVVAKAHTFYRFSTRETLFAARNAEILGEQAQRRGLAVEGVLDIQLAKSNRNARPRSLDDYYESVLVLRKPD